MNENLIIGESSQLSYYFPREYDRVSSRNIDLGSLQKKNYKNIFLLFSEQRTFLNENEDFYLSVNFDLTMKVIDKLKNSCERIVTYSTSELWNNLTGPISTKNKFDYKYSPYIKSKDIFSRYITENKKKYSNVQIIYPFNFNSPHRKKGFLFSKVFDSVINKTRHEVGDLNILRDLIHPSTIVKESITNYGDFVIGGGELINVRNFINDIFSNFNMNMENYLSINENKFNNERKDFFCEKNFSNYNELLKLTCDDIEQNIISKRNDKF